MIQYPALFGALLIAGGCAAIACALYAAQGKYKQTIQKVFLACCCALLVWGTGLAIMTAAATQDISNIGGYIAPAGYCVMFCLILHYALLLTQRTTLLKQWWGYVLLYAPGAISLFGFSILPLMTGQRYALLATPLGWANVSMNGWVWFYYCYYSSYTLITMALLWRWSRKTSDPAVRMQSLWMLCSLAISVALGSFTDIVLGFLNIRTPSVASVFSFLPIFAIGYSVNRYGLMRAPAPDARTIILDKSTRTGLFRALGLSFAGGSLLNLLSQRVLYREEMLSSAYVFSGVLMVAALMILLLNRLKLEEAFQELLVAFVICFFIPFITLRFAMYGGLTVWASFFVLLVISLLFNQRILLTCVLLSALMSQFVLWAVTPDVQVRLDMADYLVRLGLIALAAGLCVFINRVYRARLRANSRYASRQNLVSKITHSFINVNEENFDRKAAWALERCGEFLQCDGGCLALALEQDLLISYSQEWLAPDVAATRAEFEQSLRTAYPALLEQIIAGRLEAFCDPRDLPEQAAQLREQLEQAGIQGLMALPVRQGERIVGFMGFAGSRPIPQWEKESLDFLTVIANTVGDAVAKIEDIKRLHHIAFHDQLTGLPNRLLLRDRLSQALPLASRTEKMVGVIFLDLDSFKAVNDTMGHETGDKLLKAMAHALFSRVRGYDTVARFGGDEFVVMLDQLSSTADLLRVLDSLMETIQKPIVLEGQEFFLTGSAGVALFPQDGSDPETLIKNADLAMYQAKGQGKNRYALCSMDMKDKAIDQMKLTNLLYRSLERQELVVYYQPQVKLETQQVVGLEALLRWMLPERGIISPSVFIPLAEQTGLIQPIGAWVLKTACSQVKLWQDMGLPPVRIAVNVSLQQLTNKDFPRQVSETLKATGLSPEYLELEVTESIANSQVSGIVDMLAGLKALGVSLSIDDFGTEYSSLSRLKQLPVDRLKLDMQFVRGIESSDKDRAIAKVIISLAQSLQMKVIAEGVETAAQLDFLSQKLCDEVQGFYYYKPMPAEQVEKILRLHSAGTGEGGKGA